jgi:hypothetical protein
MIDFYFLCIDEIVVGSLFISENDAYRYSKRFACGYNFQIYRFDGAAEELICQYPASYGSPREIKSHPLVQEKWRLLSPHCPSSFSGERLETQ